MAGSNSPVSPLFLPLLAALPLLYLQFFPLLDQFGGRMGDAKAHFNHSSHGALNNDKCWKFPVGQACEDVRIHQDSGTAFLACGYPSTRAAFYPPLDNNDKTSAASYREYFVKYDLETNKTSTLNVVGFDNRDLVLHGIDLVRDSSSASRDKVQLWAVNHDRSHESILKFTHQLGTNDLVFEREYTHPLIKTPNAVAASGPQSFFISNDHYFYPGALNILGFPLGLYLKKLETSWGPFRWASGIVHCETASNGGKLECKEVSPPGQHAHANGILLVDGGKTLLVNEIIKATTTVYDVDPVSRVLTVRQEVDLGAAADNLSEIPGTGDLAVCVFPSPVQLRARLAPTNILNHSMHGEAAVLLLRKKRNPDNQPTTLKPTYADPEVLYWDDGSLITVLTGAAVDPVRKKMVAGGVVAEYFLVCDLQGARL